MAMVEIRPSLDVELFGRRAVACPRWEWMPGMCTTEGIRIYRVFATIEVYGHGRAFVRHIDDTGDSDRDTLTEDDLPDFNDDGTVGCLDALCRRLHGETFCVVWSAQWKQWYPYLGGDVLSAATDKYRAVGGFDTRIEALIVALEVAP